MSYPWIHESELAAARAEYEAGDILDHEGRAEQRRIEELMERDPRVPGLGRREAPGTVRHGAAAPGT